MTKTYAEQFVSDPVKLRFYERERAIEAVTNRVCELMDEQGVNRTELARRLGKSNGWITQLLDGEKNKTVRTLSDVFVALGRSLNFYDGQLAQGILGKSGVSRAEMENQLNMRFTVPWKSAAQAAATDTESESNRDCEPTTLSEQIPA
jgi:transcriptional regulator with XRE-family HTH domain